jgi:DNA-binding XRE family transcriptional regulator
MTEPATPKRKAHPSFTAPGKNSSGKSYRESARFRELLTQVGQDLTTIRKGKGLNQRQVDEHFQINRNSLIKVERGERPGTTLWLIWHLADVLGYDTKVVFTRKRRHERKELSDGVRGPDGG